MPRGNNKFHGMCMSQGKTALKEWECPRVNIFPRGKSVPGSRKQFAREESDSEENRTELSWKRYTCKVTGKGGQTAILVRWSAVQRTTEMLADQRTGKNSGPAPADYRN